MKPSKHIDEPTHRMVNDQGHWDYPHHLLVSNKPDPGARKPDTYKAVELRRRKHGWTAERQRTFLNVLANAGSIAHAAEAADAALGLPPAQPSGGRTLHRRGSPLSQRHAGPGGAPIARHVLEHTPPAMRDSVTLV